MSTEQQKIVKPQDVPYEEFLKISRWSREVIVTEKIDGTNALVYIDDKCENIYAGSRTKWISWDDDNKGFAKWVQENREELMKLGPGKHFGEWWGQGIGAGYGLKEKRFSLFNTHRWGPDETRPKCCHVVPVLFRGQMDELCRPFLLDDKGRQWTDDLTGLERILENLRTGGSVAAPGFMRPEGVVIFCPAGGQLFKKTLENDASPKSLVK